MGHWGRKVQLVHSGSVPHPTLPDPPKICFQTIPNQDSSLCKGISGSYYRRLTFKWKKKEIVIYLHMKWKVCLSAGKAKLEFKIYTLAKITSAMRNMHEVFWKAGIPNRREHIWMATQKYFYICTNKISCPHCVLFIKSFHQKKVNQYGNDNSWDI